MAKLYKRSAHHPPPTAQLPLCTAPSCCDAALTSNPPTGRNPPPSCPSTQAPKIPRGCKHRLPENTAYPIRGALLAPTGTAPPLSRNVGLMLGEINEKERRHSKRQARIRTWSLIYFPFSLSPPPPFPFPALACRSLSAFFSADQIGVGANVIYTCLAAVTGIATLFAMLYVARMDAFAGVDRVERLKEVILKVGTLSAFGRLECMLRDRATSLSKSAYVWLHEIATTNTITYPCIDRPLNARLNQSTTGIIFSLDGFRRVNTIPQKCLPSDRR